MSAPAASPSPTTFAAVGVYLALLVAERLWELSLSARHVRRLVARGAVEHGRGHYRWIVVFHTLWPIALATEVLVLGARPAPRWPVWFALLAGAHVLRLVVIRALGERWTTRIWVIPGAARIRTGPYRFLSHPNYLAVAIEVASAPMMFGAWRTAVAATVVNGILLAIRIRAEERALEGR